jgi:hypothetical protein
MAVVRSCLGGVAMDIPIILSLLLLMSLRTGLVEQTMDRSHLSARRARPGRPVLLRHFEMSCPALMTREPAQNELPELGGRSVPRLHQVRGHLARRGDAIYWRRPHWRGHVQLHPCRSDSVAGAMAPAAGVAGVTP